jgi:hypothetical protein
MTWYKTIKLAASPKNIISNWKVDDPFLKFFIYTYEPLIDLNKIKNKDDLTTFIKTSLIPDLKKKTHRDGRSPYGSSNSYYKKSMTTDEIDAELEEHQDDPRLSNVVSQWKNSKRTGDMQFYKNTENELLKTVNDDKQESFDKWWKFMSEDYPDNPAFFYSIINPMFDKSKEDRKNPSPPAHREAISLIADEIGTKGVNQMNVAKKFSRISFNLDKSTSESIDLDNEGVQINRNNEKYQNASDEEIQQSQKNSKNCWMRVDSMKTDRDNFIPNQEKLMRQSTDAGWCVAQHHYSDMFLKRGNFWLYCEKEKPIAAIRLEGEKDIGEIRGLYNKQKTLDPLWEPVTSFLHQTDINYQNNSYYLHLQDIMMKNANIDDPKVFRNLLNAIESDPKQFGLISEKNKQKFPEQVQKLAIAAAAGYGENLEKHLNAIENPKSEESYQNRFSNFQDELDSIPEEVRPYISNDIEVRLVTAHKNAFIKNPLEYEFFPDDMKRAISWDDKKESWTRYVGNDPYRYNDSRIDSPDMKSPDGESLRRYIPLRPIVEGWDALVNQNINHADNIPPFILNLKSKKGNLIFPKNYIENKIIKDFKKYPCNKTSEGYDKLQRIKERKLMTENDIIAVYANFVNENKNNNKMLNPIDLIPQEYREIIMNSFSSLDPQQEKNDIPSVNIDIHSIAIRYYQKVINNPKTFKGIDNPEIKNILINDPRYSEGIRNAFENRKQHYSNLGNFWVDIPDDIKPIMSDTTKQSVADFYLPYVQNDPSFLNKISPEIQPYVTNKLAMGYNWYKKAGLRDFMAGFLGMSIFSIAVLLGLSVAEIEDKISQNPQELAQEIRQKQQTQQTQPPAPFVPSFSRKDIQTTLDEENRPEAKQAPPERPQAIKTPKVAPQKASSIDLDKIWDIESSRGTDPDMGKSSKGARGHFQFMEDTWNECVKRMGKKWDWLNGSMDYKKSAAVADFYFNKRIPQMLNSYKIEDTIKARIAAYSWGIGQLKKLKKKKLPGDMDSQIEQYAPLETTDYIKKYGV